jgi:hypothetical protein
VAGERAREVGQRPEKEFLFCHRVCLR